jgi:hypothetical protein
MVEATIHEELHPTAQRAEQGGYGQRGNHNGELGLLLLAG